MDGPTIDLSAKNDNIEFDELDDEQIAAFLAQEEDDGPDFDIDVEENEYWRNERRKIENAGLRDSVHNGSFESLRDDPNCTELLKGVPLNVYVPGAEIILPDDDPTDSLREYI